MEEWKEYRYTDIATLIGGGTPKTSNPSYWGGNIPWLSVKDFGNDAKYVYQTEKTITEEGLNNSSTKLLQKDEIIISARGTIGEMAMIPFPMSFNQSCFGIRGKENVDKDFLYYLTKTKINNLKSSSHGSVFDTITRATFDNIIISLPSLPTQQKIANILSSLDDKIEVNRRINEQLEELAQALFKSWFVDFEPFKDGEFVQSELGMIPKGWKVGKFTDIVEIKGGGTPKTDIAEYWNGDIPFFTPKDINDVFCIETEKNITDLGLSKCSSRLYSKNTVFITARGTVGKICMAGRDMAMNQTCYALLGKENYGQHFIYMQTINIVERMKKKANGAVFSAITTRDFDSEKIVIPSVEIVSDFLPKIKSNYESILRNQQEITHLTNLRDTLLPKLMSGEIDVNEVEL